MLNVIQKLYEIQQGIRSTKDLVNSYAHYNYRSNESIIEALKPLLKNYRCVLVQSDTLENKGDRHYVESTSTIIDLDSGEKISASASAREQSLKKGMDEAQITGAASSYSRKYSLCGLLALDDNKDPDSMDNRDELKSCDKLIHYAKNNGLSADDAIVKAKAKYKVSLDMEEKIRKEMSK